LFSFVFWSIFDGLLQVFQEIGPFNFFDSAVWVLLFNVPGVSIEGYCYLTFS